MVAQASLQSCAQKVACSVHLLVVCSMARLLSWILFDLLGWSLVYCRIKKRSIHSEALFRRLPSHATVPRAHFPGHACHDGLLGLPFRRPWMGNIDSSLPWTVLFWLHPGCGSYFRSPPTGSQVQSARGQDQISGWDASPVWWGSCEWSVWPSGKFHQRGWRSATARLHPCCTKVCSLSTIIVEAIAIQFLVFCFVFCLELEGALTNFFVWLLQLLANFILTTTNVHQSCDQRLNSSFPLFHSHRTLSHYSSCNYLHFQSFFFVS